MASKMKRLEIIGQKVIGLSLSDLETFCSTALTFMNQPYKECNCSHKLLRPQTLKPQKKLSINQVNFSQTESKLLSWVSCILSLQDIFTYSIDIRQTENSFYGWLLNDLYVFGDFRSSTGLPIEVISLKHSSTQSNPDFLFAFLRIAMNETLFKNGKINKQVLLCLTLNISFLIKVLKVAPNVWKPNQDHQTS